VRHRDEPAAAADEPLGSHRRAATDA
jgi:hypothetical protein